jgi:hypothetical protein
MIPKNEDQIILVEGRGAGKTDARLKKILKLVGAFITSEPKIQIIKPKSKYHK